MSSYIINIFCEQTFFQISVLPTLQPGEQALHGDLVSPKEAGQGVEQKEGQQKGPWDLAWDRGKGEACFQDDTPECSLDRIVKIQIAIFEI